MSPALKYKRGEIAMDLQDLLKKARNSSMSAEDRERQRQSFAYGNSNIENEKITRETIRRESEKLRASGG